LKDELQDGVDRRLTKRQLASLALMQLEKDGT
jgi:hypothetical protein